MPTLSNDIESQNEPLPQQPIDNRETQGNSHTERNDPSLENPHTWDQNRQTTLFEEFHERVEELRSCRAMCLLCILGPCLLPRLCCLYGPSAVCSCILIFCCGIQLMEEEPSSYEAPIDPQDLLRLRQDIAKQISTRKVLEVTSGTDNSTALNLSSVPSLTKLPPTTRVPVSNVAVAVSQGIATTKKTAKFSDIIYETNDTSIPEELEGSLSQGLTEERHVHFDDATSEIMLTRKDKSENVETDAKKQKLPSKSGEKPSKEQEQQKRSDSGKIKSSLVMDENEISEQLKPENAAKETIESVTRKETKSSSLIPDEDTEKSELEMDDDSDETAKFLKNTNSEVSNDSIQSWHENYITCSICISDYEVDDLVSWSRNKECNHAFHKECIIDWLVRNQNCPCCRLPYIQHPDQNNEQL